MRSLLLCLLLLWDTTTPCFSCAAVTIARGNVVNADQEVIMIWDKETKTQHFIRQANFKTDAKDVGFIVPSPSRPQLEESDNDAFDTLKQITAPYVMSGPSFSIGCSAAVPTAQRSSVRVIEEKRVAGYDATVLTARSGKDLVDWLEQNGYPYSPALAEWAAPYLGGDWHFTVLKLTKKGSANKDIKASALRITFRTERPLFPYREPESTTAKSNLDVSSRLLRIYFIAETRYLAQIDGGKKWSGNAVWADDITRHKSTLLKSLKLTESTGPKTWWLTEFEDNWRYEKAAGDVYFKPNPDPTPLDTRSTVHPRSRNAAFPPSYDAAFLGVFLFLGSRVMFRRRRVEI
ncbi:MAG: DUF2330 domain-containing protein [Akkermansiaceae bacterium]|jgi:hypothetical protein